MFNLNRPKTIILDNHIVNSRELDNSISFVFRLDGSLILRYATVRGDIDVPFNYDIPLKEQLNSLCNSADIPVKNEISYGIKTDTKTFNFSVFATRKSFFDGVILEKLDTGEIIRNIKFDKLYKDFIQPFLETNSRLINVKKDERFRNFYSLSCYDTLLGLTEQTIYSPRLDLDSMQSDHTGLFKYFKNGKICPNIFKFVIELEVTDEVTPYFYNIRNKSEFKVFQSKYDSDLVFEGDLYRDRLVTYDVDNKSYFLKYENGEYKLVRNDYSNYKFLALVALEKSLILYDTISDSSVYSNLKIDIEPDFRFSKGDIFSLRHGGLNYRFIASSKNTCSCESDCNNIIQTNEFVFSSSEIVNEQDSIEVIVNDFIPLEEFQEVEYNFSTGLKNKVQIYHVRKSETETRFNIYDKRILDNIEVIKNKATFRVPSFSYLYVPFDYTIRTEEFFKFVNEFINIRSNDMYYFDSFIDNGSLMLVSKSTGVVYRPLLNVKIRKFDTINKIKANDIKLEPLKYNFKDAQRRVDIFGYTIAEFSGWTKRQKNTLLIFKKSDFYSIDKEDLYLTVGNKISPLLKTKISNKTIQYTNYFIDDDNFEDYIAVILEEDAKDVDLSKVSIKHKYKPVVEEIYPYKYK